MRNHVRTREAPRWAGEPCDPVDAASSLASNAIRVARSRSSNEYFLCPMAVILPVITASIKPGTIQPDLAGGGGVPGDEQFEIGDLLAAGPGPGAGCGAGRGCGGGVADGALPALGAGGGASGLLHRGAADRAESGPGGTGSHPLDDQPTIVNNPTGSPVRAVITPIFGHHPNEKSDLKHHVHADSPDSPTL